MHPDLERIVAEDEMARAAVADAAAGARAQIDAVRTELARARETRLRELERQLDDAIAAIEAEAQQEADIRQRRREAFERERVAAAARLTDDAVDRFVTIVRDGPADRGPR